MGPIHRSRAIIYKLSEKGSSTVKNVVMKSLQKWFWPVVKIGVNVSAITFIDMLYVIVWTSFVPVLL